MVGYALLGATWLILKTDDDVQRLARKAAFGLALALLGLIGLVSLLTPFLNAHFMQKWFAWPAMAFVAPVPLLVLVCAYALFKGLADKSNLMPFLAAQGLFALSYIGLLISFFPYIVPSSLTLWQAAAPDNSLRFLLVGAVVLIPIILAYTAYAYWVFRGKVQAKHHYH